MKEWTLGGILVVGLVILAFVLPERAPTPSDGSPAEPAEGDSPKDTVSALFAAAADGDDRAYFELVTGPLRESLTRARTEAGTEAFRDELRRSAAGIKGLAVRLGENAPPGLVAVDAELVFVDRVERQRLLLRQEGEAWRITSIDTARVEEPPIPYGTPVFEDPPEQSDSQR